MCRAHYNRWYRYGDTSKMMRPRAYDGAECLVADCESTAKTRGYCRLHYQRWRNNGDPLVDRRAGAANVAWRGTDASYGAKHTRVHRARGKADHCERCGKSDLDATYNWANLTGNYDDVWDYESMCVPCHAAYDGRVCGEKHWRAVLTERIVREARVRHAKGESGYSLAEDYGVSPSTMNRAISGETWSHI
jgi:hypothetical protein